MKEPVFRGCCTALITPFSEDGIDYARLGALLDRQAEAGVAAVVIAGTTGENATLEDAEYAQLLPYCVQRIHGAMKVIAGIGGNHTLHCMEKAVLAEQAGADALLMSTPYYNKSTQRGLAAHFSYVADRSALPLILYNVPSRTGIGIEAETYRILSEHPNINGVKEASGNISLAARIMAECGDELNVWSGNDDQTVPMMALGAKGVVSVASNVVPEVTVRLCEHCEQQDYSAAAALFAQYEPLCRALFAETNPIPVKAAMQMLGLDSGTLRLPLVELAPEHRSALEECLRNTNLLQ